MEIGTPADWLFVRQSIRHWKQDGDLAAVRDKDALEKWPEEERKEWQQLWADVAALASHAAVTR